MAHGLICPRSGIETTSTALRGRFSMAGPPGSPSQPLSPATPAFDWWAHEYSGHGGEDGSQTWTQQYRLPLTKADLATATVEDPVCQPRDPPGPR